LIVDEYFGDGKRAVIVIQRVKKFRGSNCYSLFLLEDQLIKFIIEETRIYRRKMNHFSISQRQRPVGNRK
jgi:hypothetical protein